MNLLVELASNLRAEATRLERIAEIAITAKDDPTIPEAIEAVMTANGRKYCSVNLRVVQLENNPPEVEWAIYDGKKIGSHDAKAATLGGAIRKALACYAPADPESDMRQAVVVVANGTPDCYAVEPPEELLAAHADYVAGIPAGHATLDLIEWAKKHAFGPLGTPLAAACKQWLDSLPF